MPSPILRVRSAYDDLILSTAGLRAFWPLDESDNTFRDLSRYGNHGTWTGSPVRAQPGPLIDGSSRAVDFNSVNDYGTVADNNALDLGDGPFTVECWCRRDQDSNFWSQAIDKGANSYDVGFTQSDTWYLGKSGVAELAKYTSTTPTDGTWHYYVVGRNGAGSHVIYRDAVAGTTEQNAASLSDTAINASIGRDTTGAQPLGGALSRLALYSRVLTANEVRHRYLVALVG